MLNPTEPVTGVVRGAVFGGWEARSDGGDYTPCRELPVPAQAAQIPQVSHLLLQNGEGDVEDRHVEGRVWCAGSEVSIAWIDRDRGTCSREREDCTSQLSCNRQCRTKRE